MLLRAAALLLVAAPLVAASPAAAAVFNPDPAFDGDGVVLNRGNAGVVAAPDGGVWIASYASLAGGELVVERRRPNGTLDPSWGAGGVVSLGSFARPVVGGQTTLAPAIIPNAIGGLDVTYTPTDAMSSMYVRRLTSSGGDPGSPTFTTAVPYTPTGYVIPDGDGLAMAANGFDQVQLTRVGPNGLMRGTTSLPELPSNQVVGLTRMADGTLVVAAGDLTGDRVIKLSARRSDLTRPAAYDAPPTLASATFGGLLTLAGSRVVAGGESSAAAALLEGRSAATGALDPGFGSAGLMTLPTPGTSPFLNRVMSMAPYADGMVVRSLEANVAGGTPEFTANVTLVRADGTVQAGPRAIAVSRTVPTFDGLPAAPAPSLDRIYVVQTDPDAPFVANVVALKVTDQPDAAPPASSPPPASTIPAGTIPQATPPASSAPPAEPAPVRVTLTKLAAARGGTVKLTVRAAAAGDLVVTATSRAGRRTLKWGPVAASFRTAGTRTVTLRPSAAVRRALARRGATLRATFTLRFVPATGGRAQLARTTTLRGLR